jgi:hypothetical protein
MQQKSCGKKLAQKQVKTKQTTEQIPPGGVENLVAAKNSDDLQQSRQFLSDFSVFPLIICARRKFCLLLGFAARNCFALIESYCFQI